MVTLFYIIHVYIDKCIICVSWNLPSRQSWCPCDVRQVLSLRGHVSSTGCSSPMQGAVFMGFLRPETY